MTGKSTTGVDDQFAPDPDMDGDGYRRLAGTYSSLAATCEASGDTETAKFHRGEADRNIALGLKADGARFAKETREAFVQTLFQIVKD